MRFDDLAVAVCAIDAAELTANAYRTAVRLALRADADRQLSLSHDELLELVGTTSHDTARSHLISLQSAGLIWYRRSAAVQIVFTQRTERALSDQNARSAIISQHERVDERALSEQSARSAIISQHERVDERALSDHSARSAIISQHERVDERALSDHSARSANKARAQRSERALSARSITTNNIYTGREVGRNTNNLPTYLPEDPEQAKTYRLLTDTAVGMDPPTAARLARKFDFELVLAHVFCVLAEIQRGGAAAARSIYVLPSRLANGGRPQITDADRASELYRRHVPIDQEQEREAADLRSRYIPAEYADVIVG